MLRHLILTPTGGMCNRLRAIASARRLCSRLDARCSVAWDWGNFWNFFAPIDAIGLLSSSPGIPEQQARHYRERYNRSRAVDTSAEVVELRSGYVFWGDDEACIDINTIVPYLPRLHPRLQQVVDDFTATHLRDAVGFHIRRTDHKTAQKHSPDDLFIDHMRMTVLNGKKIFLATDNALTEAKMRERFGTAIITYPKRQELACRWPRSFDQIAVEDDLIDFFLLVNTDHVIGSFFSSFSGMAIALNGSVKSRILKK